MHKTKPKGPARKKAGLKFAGKKRLTPLRTEKIKIRKAIEARLDYPIAKLSGIVKKPSNYRVKRRVIVYAKGESKYVPKKVWVKAHSERSRWGGIHWIPEGKVTRLVEETTRGKAIGEKLIVSKNRKKGGGGKKGSSGGERVSHKTGTSQARKGAAKAARVGGTKGGRPQRDTKKKKKKK